MRGDWRHAPSRPQRAARAGKGGPDPAELAGLLGPVAQAAGMDLESVRVSAAGRRRLLRVVVDCDGGPGLDDIAEVSRQISERLDATDAMGGAAYTLEVSSPGVDRPLTEPRHWRRARGRLVAVALASARDGAVSLGQTGPADGPGAAQQVTARVVAASETGVTLDTGGRYREFSYSQLGPGRVQVEFGAGAAPQDVGSGDGH